MAKGKHTGRGRSSDYRKLIKKAKDAGWTITRTGSGHVRFQPPNKSLRPVIASFSPGSSGTKLTEAQLRKAGLKL